MTIQEKSQNAGRVYPNSVRVSGSGDAQGITCGVGFAQYGGDAFGEGFDGEVVEPDGAGALAKKKVGKYKETDYYQIGFHFFKSINGGWNRLFQAAFGV